MHTIHMISRKNMCIYIYTHKDPIQLYPVSRPVCDLRLFAVINCCSIVTICPLFGCSAHIYCFGYFWRKVRFRGCRNLAKSSHIRFLRGIGNGSKNMVTFTTGAAAVAANGRTGYGIPCDFCIHFVT